MNYRGIEYSVRPTADPEVWCWQFRIDNSVRSGQTRTRLELLALRRVQQLIDRELRRLEQ